MSSPTVSATPSSPQMSRNETLICVPIMGDSVDIVIKDIVKAKDAGADLVEVRLDFLNSPINDPRSILSSIISSSVLPILFTYRPIWEGGRYEGDEEERLNVLRLAMELGASFIDIELKASREMVNSIISKKPSTCKIIMSSHNYENTPSMEDLSNLVVKIQEAGADIVKIATTAVDISDVSRIFRIMVHCQVPIISMAMGERGVISRILSAKFGGFLTFGILENGQSSAPGQPTIKNLLELYNFRSIGPDTRVHGIIGNPVSHSKSPLLYNPSFKSLNYNGVFVHLLVDDLPSFLGTFATFDFCGFSCTIPHKETALKCCDVVDPIAKRIGAVNCIIRDKKDGKLYGYNTDYSGAITAIEDGLLRVSERNTAGESPLAGRTFVVIGAGGAGKALAYGAKEKGSRVVIANRTYERAKELADWIGGEAITLSGLKDMKGEKGMILANTTSIGMQPNVHETPIPKEALGRYALVFDAVYTPKMTRLLTEAEACGCAIVTGLEMFIGQAYEQFQRFTSLPAPKELFKSIMSKY